MTPTDAEIRHKLAASRRMRLHASGVSVRARGQAMTPTDAEIRHKLALAKAVADRHSSDWKIIGLRVVTAGRESSVCDAFTPHMAEHIAASDPTTLTAVYAELLELRAEVAWLRNLPLTTMTLCQYCEHPLHWHDANGCAFFRCACDAKS